MTTYENLLRIIRLSFENEPFHTLRLLYGEEVGSQIPGGTCSEKTLSFIRIARESGFTADLHTAFIGGEEIHRLARLEIKQQTYFVDVGNGWPAMTPYPDNQPVHFQCFGMGFRTEVDESEVIVYHTKEGIEKMQMRIPRRQKDSSKIIEDIRSRFDSGRTYPFSGKLRFSSIVDNEFLFLRDDYMYIYSSTKEVQRIRISLENVFEIIEEFFGFKIQPRSNDYEK